MKVLDSFLMGTILGVVFFVRQVLSQNMAQPEIDMRLKLTTNELFIIDMMQYSGSIRQIKVEEEVPTNYGNNINVTTTQDGSGRNITEGTYVAANNTNLSWIYQDYFYYSVSENDCIKKGELSPFLNSKPNIERRLYEDELWTKDYPYNLTTQQILSRQFKFTYQYMYITTCYFQVYDDILQPTNYINLMETKRMRYNKTIMDVAQISDAPGCNRTNYWRSLPDIFGDTGVPKVYEMPNITCFFGYYMLIYDETIYICNTQGYQVEAELYFYRSGAKKYYKFGTLPAKYAQAYVFENPLGELKVLVEPTLDNSFEILIHFFKKSDVFIFNFNQNEVFNIQSYKLSFQIYEIMFVKRTLMIFYSDDSQNQKTYYLGRNPGSSFYPDKILLFADAKFLSSLYSNENIEIILEMYKQFHTKAEQDKMSLDEKKGFVPPITHLLYSYDLTERKIKQISTQIFTTHLDDAVEGVTYRIDSFSNLDMIVLMAHLQIRYAGTNWAMDRRSVQLNMDAFSGFGCTSQFNPDYKVYPSATNYDPWTEHYFMLPYDGNLLGPPPTVVPDGKKVCDILRIRVYRPFLRIQYSKRSESYTLLLQDEKIQNKFNFHSSNITRPITVFRLNLTYYNDSDPFFNNNSIWQGSNMTSFQVNANFEKRYIDLEFLAKGNFIIRVNSQPDLANLLHFPYYSASMEDANKVLASSFYQVENYRIKNANDIYLTEIQTIKAFGVTENNIISRKLIMIKTKKEANLTIYSIPNGATTMVQIPGLTLPTNILKVFPVKENIYIFFDVDGALSLFDARNVTLTPLSFPGVGCTDLDLLAHNRIKPALICYNINNKFTIYYIDDVISKSLTNSYQDILIKPYYGDLMKPALTSGCKILISEFYMGKLFVFHPDAKKGQPNFSVYYLDLEELPVLYFLKSGIILNQQAEERGLTSKLQSLEFVEDRLVVHYRFRDDVNFIGVYKFNDSHDPTPTKIFKIPEKYQVDDKAEMSMFDRHFQSSVYANRYKPYLLLPVRVGAQKHYNVLVIDPFGPISETVPTLLLPINSTSQESVSYLFEYYVASVNRIRYYSAGMLHYSPNPANSYRDEKNMYYLFQLIDADTPKVYFNLDREKVISYKNLFLEGKTLLNEKQDFKFRSDQYPSNIIDSSLEISQKAKAEGNVTSGDRTIDSIKIPLKDKYTNASDNRKHPKITMYEANFTEMPEVKNTSLFDWKLEAESFFDNMVGTFQFTMPLNLGKTLTNQDVSTIVNIDTFCRSYKMNKGELQCVKLNWIFFHRDEIEIFNTDKIEDISSKSSIRFPFNVNECTEGVVVNHTLISTCTFNNERKIIMTNLIDLSQNYIPQPGLNIFAKASTPRIIKTYERAFLQYSKSIIDERNIKGVANNYYFMYDQKVDQNMKKECTTHISTYLQYIYGVDSKLTDSAYGVGRLQSYTVTDVNNNPITYSPPQMLYKVSGININTGNLIYVQIFEESYHIGPLVITKKEGGSSEDWPRTSTSNVRIAVLKIQASTDVRKVVLNGASITNVVFNPNDAIAKDNTDSHYFRFSLIHFPSYHSYLYRYRKNSELINLSFLKLENPFSEIENKHWDNRACCFNWACILISTFDDGKSFVKIYDMRYEELSTPEISPNFPTIFPNITDVMKEKDLVKSSESDTLDLDLISSAYTIQPIQILNTSNLRLIRFDEQGSNNDTLRVAFFYLDNRVEFYNLSRKARLTANNLYFMSKYVDLKVRMSYNRFLKYRFDIESYLEKDFYKYIIQGALIVGFGLTLIYFYYRYLRSEQEKVQKEDQDQANLELENRKSLIEEIKKIVFMQEGTQPQMRNSLIKRMSKMSQRKSSYRKSVAATELMQWIEQDKSDEDIGKGKFAT